MAHKHLKKTIRCEGTLTEHHPHLTFILTRFQNPVKALVAVRLRLLEKTL